MDALRAALAVVPPLPHEAWHLWRSWKRLTGRTRIWDGGTTTMLHRQHPNPLLLELAVLHQLWKQPLELGCWVTLR